MKPTFLQTLAEEYRTDYNPSDVLSKLSSMDRKATDNKATNTTVFGLEDSEGQIIKVHVSRDQAEDFENALAIELDVETEMNKREIAEVLYDLHDRFDIVDVEWPSIEEDEEGDETSAADFDDANADSEDPNAPPVDGTDPSAPPMDGGEDPLADPTQNQANDALDAVLQAMTADAEARRQQAIADAAESRAREAEAAAKIADQKLRAEEEVADMEAYHDSQNDQKKEAKKLAKLAKYRHAMKQRDQEEGPYSTPADALDDIEQASSDRMDMPSGENPEGTDPSSPPTNNDNTDIKSDLKASGVENEESTNHVDGPKTPHRRFKDLKAAVSHLHSLKVRRANR